MQATVTGLLGRDKRHARIEEIKRAKGAPPWSEKIVVNDQIVGTLICQPPGHRLSRVEQVGIHDRAGAQRRRRPRHALRRQRGWERAYTVPAASWSRSSTVSSSSPSIRRRATRNVAR